MLEGVGLASVVGRDCYQWEHCLALITALCELLYYITSYLIDIMIACNTHLYMTALNPMVHYSPNKVVDNDYVELGQYCDYFLH